MFTWKSVRKDWVGLGWDEPQSSGNAANEGSEETQGKPSRSQAHEAGWKWKVDSFCNFFSYFMHLHGGWSPTRNCQYFCRLSWERDRPQRLSLHGHSQVEHDIRDCETQLQILCHSYVRGNLFKQIQVSGAYVYLRITRLIFWFDSRWNEMISEVGFHEFCIRELISVRKRFIKYCVLWLTLCKYRWEPTTIPVNHQLPLFFFFFLHISQHRSCTALWTIGYISVKNW